MRLNLLLKLLVLWLLCGISGWIMGEGIGRIGGVDSSLGIALTLIGVAIFFSAMYQIVCATQEKQQ